jgi:hypothetical protein
MREFNVKTIIYSGTNGEILKQRFRDYIPKVFSLGRQFIMNGYNTIYRVRSDVRKTTNVDYDDDKTISTRSISISDSSSIESSDDIVCSTPDNYSTATSYTNISRTHSKSNKRHRRENVINKLKRYH